MIRFSLVLLFLLPVDLFAHCPYPLEVDGDSYCAEIEWLVGERKIKGEFKEAKDLTPYLIPQSEPQIRWIYSQARIYIWEKGDASHQLVQIPNLSIFPYMYMESGHHHEADYHEFFEESDFYRLRRMPLHEMRGCWSLRWSTASQPTYSTSERLISLVSYENLTTSGNDTQAAYCENLATPPGGGHHHH